MTFKNVKHSTNQTYRQVWKLFNNFLVKLDEKLRLWEQRTVLFCGYLINKGRKSTTIKSYISATKFTLKAINYKWDDSKVLVDSLTKACKLINDKVRTRLPIHWKLLEFMLFELGHIFHNQNYLKILYRTMLAIGYFGLFLIYGKK